jgi:hypothetical protein
LISSSHLPLKLYSNCIKPLALRRNGRASLMSGRGQSGSSLLAF